MLNVGTMVGTSLFVLPGTVAAALHAPGLVIGAWAGGGILVLLGALCLAELAAAMPDAGGEVVYLERAFGRVWGYLYGWANGVIINPCAIAAIAIAFATYLGVLVPLGRPGVKGWAILSIVALTGLNMLGVRAGATAQNAITALKVLGVAGLAALALLAPAGVPSPAGPAPGTVTLQGAVLAVVAIVWAYDGWYEVTFVGGEVRDPGRTLPRSIVWSMVVVILLYAAANLGYLAALGVSGMAASARVGSDAASAVLGPRGASVAAAVVATCALGGNNGIILTAARIPYVMAREGMFFRPVGRLDPRHGTPVVSLAWQGTWAMALVLLGAYEQLVTAIVFSSFIFHGLAALAVLRLRHAAPALPRPYRTWGYPATPVVFAALCAVLVALTLTASPRESLFGLGLLLAGLALYPAFRRAAP